MTTKGLRLPVELVELMANGCWPLTESDSRGQGWSTVGVSIERLQAVVPWERAIWLYRPPFCTVSEHDAAERSPRLVPFWSGPIAAPTEIVASLTVVLGDFGLGSDAPFVLDYRSAAANPEVLALKWGQRGNNSAAYDNHWVKVAETFGEFASRIGLYDVGLG